MIKKIVSPLGLTALMCGTGSGLRKVCIAPSYTKDLFSDEVVKNLRNLICSCN